MFGMMRTTGTPFARRSSYHSVLLPAAMVRTILSLVTLLLISSITPGMTCGFTASTMTSDFCTTSAALAQGIIPCFSLSARVFASERLYP